MMVQKKNYWFTLVELIIVISILAILAVISFISFQWFVTQSRDSNRLITIKNIDTGLWLFKIKAWNFPLPDNIYGTGVIDNILLHYVWNIWETVWNSINFKWKITDPKDNHYLYGVSFDKKNYQIATFLEQEEYASTIFPQVNANNGEKGYLVWNYDWLLIYHSWAFLKYIINLPSLIFSQTGTVDVISTEPSFLYKWKKLWIWKNDLLKEITGKNISLTWIALTNNQSQITQLSNQLGYDKKKIGEKIFWKKYIDSIITNKLGIYYGWPSSLNNTKNDWHLDKIVADLNEYDTIIIGDWLEDPSHLDYQNTKDILHGTGGSLWYAPEWFSGYNGISYGYVSLMNSIWTIQDKIDKWKNLWVDGIFFDEAGYDFLIDEYTFTTKTDVRTHQNTATDYAHSQWFKVIMNSWVIDDVFGTSNGEAPTTLTSWDGYLMESFVYNPHAIETDYYDYDNELGKLQKAVEYKNTFWVNILCVWLLPNSSYITPERVDTFYEKSSWVCDYIQITEESFWAASPHDLINYLKDYK